MKKKLFYANMETWASPTELRVNTCDNKSLQKHNDTCRKEDKCKTGALEVSQPSRRAHCLLITRTLEQVG